MLGPLKGAGRVKDTPRNQGWLLSLLPAFPLVLLVMRLWYASRQDTQTLLLLVQNISPLGMLTAVLLTTVWVLPALILGGQLLGTLYWISTGRSSWLVRAAERLPGWVVALAVAVGLSVWQLRFLPTLVMLSLAVAGLVVRDRYPRDKGLRGIVCYALPVTVAVLSYMVLWPAIGSALAARDIPTVILLTLPPGITVLLTGPVPQRSARVLTHGIAVAMAVLTPLLVGAVVMKAPILPLMALQMTAKETDGETTEKEGKGSVKEAGGAGKETDEEADGEELRVLVGYLVAVDDQMSTVLSREGRVSFVPNDRVESRVLCPDPGEVPRTWANLHGWYVEQSMLSWLAPAPSLVPVDLRCQGRPED
ncbi:hypothetical protein [Streptosporangium sp. NPDC087985]|uniref:hypothetical protein n=1 Tax=Streptosporangium sp. NPDC087985 TaxID=3366196 RepID=UPI0037FBAD6D